MENHPWQSKLERYLAGQSAHVRRTGRYRAAKRVWWCLFAVGCVTAADFLLYHYWVYAGGRTDWFFPAVFAAISAYLCWRLLRQLWLQSIHTGRPAPDAVMQLQAVLTWAGYAVDWMDNGGIAVLPVHVGKGSLKEHHAVVIIPADGTLYYTVHDVRGPSLWVVNCRPLQNLISNLEAHFRAEGAPHAA